jgi:hypothetical protein
MTPKQMAGMLKQMPKPKDAAGADPKQKALLAFSDKELQGKGYVNWTPFKHPTLVDVEIGGMVPFTDTTPPASMLKALLDGQVPWVLSLSEKLPRLKVLRTEARAKGAGVYAITLWVENTGYLPFPTAMGRKNLHVPPAVVSLAVKDVTFLQGRARTPINAIDGLKNVKLEWLVQVPPTLAGIDVTLESANAGGDTGRIALGSAQGGVK